MQERLHKYEVELSEDQRFVLQQLIAKGNACPVPARKLAHARILLKIVGAVPMISCPLVVRPVRVTVVVPQTIPVFCVRGPR